MTRSCSLRPCPLMSESSTPSMPCLVPDDTKFQPMPMLDPILDPAPPAPHAHEDVQHAPVHIVPAPIDHPAPALGQPASVPPSPLGSSILRLLTPVLGCLSLITPLTSLVRPYFRPLLPLQNLEVASLLLNLQNGYQLCRKN